MDVDINENTERTSPYLKYFRPRQISIEPKKEKNTENAAPIEDTGYKIYRQLHIASLGILLNISAYYGLINLQSSINIRDSLGTIGLTVGYVSSVLWALFLTPIAIDYFGAKTSLIISEMTYLIYCAANFYPSFYTLIPSAVILGFGEACCWASMSVLVTYYGEKYWKLKQLKQSQATFSITSYMTSSHNPEHANSVSTYGGMNLSSVTSPADSAMAWVNRKKHANESYVNNIPKGKSAILSRFFGRYFSIVKASQVVGNVLSFVALGDRSFLMGTESLNITYLNETNEFSAKNFTDMSMCGIAECVVRMDNMPTSELSRYTVKNTLGVYLLFGGFIVMHITAMLIHYYLLDPMPRQTQSINKKQQRKENGSFKSRYGFPNANNKTNPFLIETSLENNNGQKRKPENRPKVIKSLSAVFKQMISIQQLLISPISLYFGVFLSYCLSEFTRAFISCTMGVSSVGLVMIVFGTSSMTSSFLLGKVMPKSGPHLLYMVAAIIDIANYIWTFKWTPDQNDLISVYVMAILLGFNAGLWEPLINSTYAKYFPRNTAAAFSLWNFWAACGIFIGFALSASVCLIFKLYLLIGTLICGILCYIGAEYRFHNNCVHIKN